MDRLNLGKMAGLRSRRSAALKAMLLGSALLLQGSVWAEENATPCPNPFFAMDNGVGRDKLTPAEQAKVVKGIGFEGISYNGTHLLAERLSAFDAVGLEIFGIYVHASFDKSPGDDKALADAIPQLKGRTTVVWLTVGRINEGDDADAVRAVRTVADMAAPSGVRVAIYPHRGNYIETAEDAMRIAELTKRDNVGITFNLCHELMSGNEKRLEEVVRKSASRLFMVTINGADPGRSVEQTIKVLGEGHVDVLALLRVLDAVGYRGPIGLQCYRVQGDMRENLTRSMQAWSRMCAERTP